MFKSFSTTTVVVAAIVFAACGPESIAEAQDTASVSQASCNPDYQQCGESCEELGTCPPPPPTCINVTTKNLTSASQSVAVYVESVDSTGSMTAGACVHYGGISAGASIPKSCAIYAPQGDRLTLRVRELSGGASTSMELTVPPSTVDCVGAVGMTYLGAMPAASCNY